MAHLVTGYAGYEHIQSKDQGAFNAIAFGKGQLVMDTGNKFNASIIDNNTVRILDGEMLMHGRHIRIEPNSYEDCVIRTGTAGKNRIDLICMTYEKNATDGTEKAYLQVIQGSEVEGTATLPTYTEGDILQGASFNQMPLYKVTIEGVVLKSAEKLFELGGTYKEQIDKLLEQVDSIQTTSSGTLSQAGWYRVAECDVVTNIYNLEMVLMREAQNHSAEIHHIVATSTTSTNKKITSYDICTASHLITTFRIVSADTKLYAEIYYNADKSNPLYVAINNHSELNTWQAITPTLTSETVDGVTVTTTYDIPSNASPVTDLDIKNNSVWNELTSGFDLNNALGRYRCKSGDITTSLLNKPSNVTKGEVEVIWLPAETTNNYGTQILLNRPSGETMGVIYVRTIAGGIWNAWDSLTTTADLANYLPKTGGTVDGEFAIASSSATLRQLKVKNSLRELAFSVQADGSGGIADNTNGKWIIKSTADGTNTFNGTATGNLPLDGGGTVQSASLAIVNLKRKEALGSAIKFTNSNGDLGSLGMTADSKPTYYESDVTKSHELLHSGNFSEYALAKDGGIVGDGTSNDPLYIKGKDEASIAFYNKDNTRFGLLGFNKANNPQFITADKAVGYDLLHKGNSAPTVVSTSAPSDTSAVWVVPNS